MFASFLKIKIVTKYLFHSIPLLPHSMRNSAMEIPNKRRFMGVSCELIICLLCETITFAHLIPLMDNFKYYFKQDTIIRPSFALHLDFGMNIYFFALYPFMNTLNHFMLAEHSICGVSKIDFHRYLSFAFDIIIIFYFKLQSRSRKVFVKNIPT